MKHHLELKQGKLDYYVYSFFTDEIELALLPSSIRQARPQDILDACSFVAQNEYVLCVILNGLGHGPWRGVPGKTSRILSHLQHLRVPPKLEESRQRAIEHLTEVLAIEQSKPRLEESNQDVSGYVYLIKSDSYYKIGVSQDVRQRIKQLGTLPPFDIKLICTIRTDSAYNLESQLHEQFEEKRVNGEWFELEDNDVEYIKELSNE